MDQILILNNKQYRMCDLGEGRCTLIINSVKHLESLTSTYYKYCEERLIVLDIVTAWSMNTTKFNQIEIEQLIDDINLLLDIYWLEEVKFGLEPPLALISMTLSSALGGQLEEGMLYR